MVRCMDTRTDLRGLDREQLDDDLRARGAHQLSDTALADAVARVLARPRLAPPDSFVLHAPLELLARTALLPSVSPQHRAAARRQITRIAANFDAFGPPMDGLETEVRGDPVDALR